jgi:KDO2-lipid IV(A) lauroyltransferase
MRDALENAGVRLAMGLASGLPAPLALDAGRGLGRLAEALGVRRAVALANVERAFGAELDARQRRALVRRSYAHLGTSFVEFLRLPQLSPDWLRAQMVLDGERHIQEALALGRGAIVGSGHLGNWEWMGACLAARGYPVTFVVQRLRNPRVESLVERVRRGAGIDVVPRGMALRRVHAALAANRLVFFMCDQDARRRGVFVPFFGVPASTPKGAAQIAVRHHVPFMASFGRREPGGRHHAVFHPPIAVHAADEDHAVRELLEAFNARLEAAVRAAPDQYWWAHRRWKTRPPAESPVVVAG